MLKEKDKHIETLNRQLNCIKNENKSGLIESKSGLIESKSGKIIDKSTQNKAIKLNFLKSIKTLKKIV